MAEKDWVTVLRTIYEEDLIWTRTRNVGEDHKAVEKTELDANAVQDSLAFLWRSGLIGEVDVGVHAEVPRSGKHGYVGPRRSGDEEPIAHFGLTEKGFQVMHDREMNATRHNLNFALVVFTFALVGVTLLQALAPFLEGTRGWLTVLAVLGAVAMGAKRLALSDWGPQRPGSQKERQGTLERLLKIFTDGDGQSDS